MNLSQFEIDDYNYECPECPYFNSFKLEWGFSEKWIQHVVKEHSYTSDEIKYFFPLWERSIEESIVYELEKYSEGDFTDRAYEEYKERNLR